MKTPINGSLGPVVFVVSTKVIIAPYNYNSSNGIVIAKHQILGKGPKYEVIGKDECSASFNLKLIKGYCIPSPRRAYEILENMMMSSLTQPVAYPFIYDYNLIGNFLIEKLSIKDESNTGDLTVAISLKSVEDFNLINFAMNAIKGALS